MNALVIADNWTSQRSDDSTIIINVKGKGTITLRDGWISFGAKINIVSSLNDIRYYNQIGNEKTM